MATKYQILWKDSDGDSFQVDISNAAYAGATNQLVGSGTITEDAASLWQPIRSRFLILKILVTTNTQALVEGLFTEEDRYWTVSCLKEGAQIFLGSLSVEPVEQPFNADVWEIQIECRDALGFLEDLAFVQDNGLNWTGSKTVIETIAKAVRRGEPELDAKDFWVSSNVTMIGLPGTLAFEENAYVNMEAFYDENDEADSCLEVLEAMVEAMGCTIFKTGTGWVIMNIELWVGLAAGAVNFRRYSGDTGTYLGVGTWTVNAPFRDIGTQTDGNIVFHVNENASYYYDKYMQFSRIKHVYEFKEQLLPNGELTGGTTSMPEWQTDPTYCSVGPELLSIIGLDSGGAQVAAISDSIRINQDNVLQIKLDVVYVGNPLYWPVSVQLAGDSQTWNYVKYSASSEAFWELDAAFDQQVLIGEAEDIQEGPFIHTIDVANLPVSGLLSVILWTPYYSPTVTTEKVIVNSVEISLPGPAQEGREATAERTDKTTGRVPEPEEIRFSTSDTSIITNTFYDSSDVPINFVYYGGVLSDIYLIEALALSRLRVEAGRLYQFSGDMKGLIEHLTPKEISSLDDGIFLIGRLDIDLSTGISSNSFLGANITAPGATYDSENRIVYKDSIKPKIK